MEILVERNWAGNAVTGSLVHEFARTSGVTSDGIVPLRPEKIEDWFATLNIDVVFYVSVLNEMRPLSIMAVIQDSLWLKERVKSLQIVWR
jgi:hypothetical protein